MEMVPSEVQGNAETRLNWLGGLGISLLLIGLVLVGGPVGLAVGMVIALVWYWLSGIAAVAVGHLLLLPLVSASTAPVNLVLLEAGFLAVLLASVLGFADPVVPLSVTAVVGTDLALITWFGWTAWEPRWLVGLVLLLIVTVSVYVLHRYQVVRFEFEGVERLS